MIDIYDYTDDQIQQLKKDIEEYEKLKFALVKYQAVVIIEVDPSHKERNTSTARCYKDMEYFKNVLDDIFSPAYFNNFDVKGLDNCRVESVNLVPKPYSFDHD